MGMKSNRLCIVSFLSCILLLAGCIVVGVDPKKEVNYSVSSSSEWLFENDIKIGSDVFSFRATVSDPQIIVKSDDVSATGNDKIVLSVIATFSQSVGSADRITTSKETWEVDDGTALSIGLFPGFGRAFYSPYGFGFGESEEDPNFKGGEAILAVPLFDSVLNFATFGMLTISSLLVCPFDDEPSEMARFGLIGCDRFLTGAPAGRTCASTESETTHGRISNDFTVRQGIDVPILATIDIPSLWFKKSVYLKPSMENDRFVSKARIEVPRLEGHDIAGTVTLSFPVKSWRFGNALAKFEGRSFAF